MTAPPPRVSVLITTRNGSTWLAATLDSILAQEFRDFELVVVDDASTDATPALLAAYALRDPRITVLTAPRNLGIVGARNFGFAACRGGYVALLDHDDLSRPTRLAAQVAHLNAHPSVVLLGTGVLVETEGRLQPDPPVPSDPLGLRWALHLGNPLTWSSVMLRAAAARRLEPFLRRDYEYADDFDLYHRMLAFGEAALLAAPLTIYRVHAENTTHREADPLFNRGVAVLAGAYRPWFGAAAVEAATLALRHLSQRRPAPDLATLDRLGSVLEAVLEHFSARLTQAERARIEAEAAFAWWEAVRSTVRSGLPGALRLFGHHPALRRGWTGPGSAERVATLATGMLRTSVPGKALILRLQHLRSVVSRVVV